MKYDTTKQTAPKMPNLGKGTECIKLLLSQASKDMHEPLVPMLFPSLGAHISGAEFQHPSLTWEETTGLMANLFLFLCFQTPEFHDNVKTELYGNPRCKLNGVAVSHPKRKIFTDKQTFSRL